MYKHSNNINCSLPHQNLQMVNDSSRITHWNENRTTLKVLISKWELIYRLVKLPNCCPVGDVLSVSTKSYPHVQCNSGIDFHWVRYQMQCNKISGFKIIRKFLISKTTLKTQAAIPISNLGIVSLLYMSRVCDGCGERKGHLQSHAKEGLPVDRHIVNGRAVHDNMAFTYLFGTKEILLICYIWVCNHMEKPAIQIYKLHVRKHKTCITTVASWLTQLSFVRWFIYQGHFQLENCMSESMVSW